jgi:hypothetical protein
MMRFGVKSYIVTQNLLALLAVGFVPLSGCVRAEEELVPIAKGAEKVVGWMSEEKTWDGVRAPTASESEGAAKAGGALPPIERAIKENDISLIKSYNLIAESSVGSSFLENDDHRLISQMGEIVSISSKSSTSKRVLAHLSTEDLKKLLPNRLGVVVEGSISPELADRLSEINVKFLRNISDYQKNPIVEPQRVRAIFIGSRDEAVAAKIFEGQDIASIRRAMKKADGIGRIVESPKELSDCLASALEDYSRPVVVCHHGENGIIFRDGTTMTLEQFAAEFKDSSPIPISCETYQVRGLSYNTTEQFFLENTVKALEKAMQRHGDTEVQLAEFLDTFVTAYEEDRRTRKVYLVGSGVSVGAGGVGFAIIVGRRVSSTDVRK